METRTLIILCCGYLILILHLADTQFGDVGIGKGISATELLNQLLLRRKNAFADQDTPPRNVAQEIDTLIQMKQKELEAETTTAAPTTTTTPAPAEETSNSFSPAMKPLGILNTVRATPVRLPFPRRSEKKKEKKKACHGRNCEEKNEEMQKTKWSMPLITLGNKQYYMGIFFKANWYKAAQYCRFHGMHLAAVESERENRVLETHVKEAGLGHEHFWTSGTDQGEEGKFFWMANGRPITYENWNAGEPNNFQYEDGEMEHCLELWNRDGKGLKWNDSPCSFETFFLCEV